MEPTATTVFDINRICRVCLIEVEKDQESNLVSIYSSDFAISPLNMIMNCTSVKINDNDELPTSICSDCIYRLGIAYQFKQLCENSDMRLRECLGLEIIVPIETINDSSKNVKEEEEKQQQQQLLNINTINNHHHHHHHHDLIATSNNDSATQVKDEEIFAAMNAVCEIFGDTVDTPPDVSLLTDSGGGGVGTTTSDEQVEHHVSLLDANCIVENDHLIDGNYLTEDISETLNANLLDTDPSDPNDLLNDDGHLLDNEELLNDDNPHDIHSSIHTDEYKDETATVNAPNEIVATDEVKIIIQTINSVSKSPKKLKRKKSSKVIKSREDLDKCLKLQQDNRKKSGETDTSSSSNSSTIDKKAKQLLKQPDQCFECGKTFAYSGYLEAHRRIHNGERPYKCHMCSLTFAQAGNLALHIRVHTGDRPFQCEICSKLFTTSSNLKAHQRIHSEARDYKCSQCERAFKSASELMSHAGTHSGIKNHICKLCGKAFYKTSYLNVHFRTVHVGEKRHRCSECGKEFSNSSNLTCHFRIHTGEKPFSCKHCEARFNQSSALIRHTKQHTSGSAKSLAKIKVNNHHHPHHHQTTEDTSIKIEPEEIHFEDPSLLSSPLPTIITIPSSIVPDFKSTISDLTINSFSTFMKDQIDFTKTTMLDFTKHQTANIFNP